MGVAAIICISESGFTVRSIARFRPQMPIIAFSPQERTVRQLTLSWGATPLFAPHRVDSLRAMDDLVCIARDQGTSRSGDRGRGARRRGQRRECTRPTCSA